MLEKVGGSVKFYKTKQWLQVRKKVLKRDMYQCVNCKRYGRNTDANVVHHCIPYREDPTLALKPFNLISLCNKCHEDMHNRITNELTTIGKYWKNKKAPLENK